MLFENRPELAAELLEQSAGIALPEFAEVRDESSDLSQLLPAEYWADHVVTLVKGGRPVLGVIVEVQLAIDVRKRFSWPVYATVLRARHRCPTCVLVLAPSLRVARWARQPIALGPPTASTFEPIVVGPRDVPIVSDPEVARRDPELALLSVQVHGHSPRGIDVAMAVLKGLGDAEAVTGDRAMLYFDLVHAALSDEARAQLEELMERGYQYQSDFAKKYVAEGEARGRAEGEARGRAEGEAKGRVAALTRILSARNLTLSNENTSRLEACTDLELLDTWIERALVAKSESEIFE